MADDVAMTAAKRWMGALPRDQFDLLLALVEEAADRARIEGVRLGIEAAAKVARPIGTNFDSDAGERYASAILALDAATIAKEAARAGA